MTALAIDSEHRSPLVPDVPTLRELGYRGDITQVYFGLVAPAGTPAPIIARLNEEFVRIGSMPAFRSKNMIDLGLEPILDRPRSSRAISRRTAWSPSVSSRRRGSSRSRGRQAMSTRLRRTLRICAAALGVLFGALGAEGLAESAGPIRLAVGAPRAARSTSIPASSPST